MFENVNYTFYSSEMGRANVPDSETFEKYVLENTMEFKKLYETGLIKPTEENGIDKAVCMMIEVQYLDEQTSSGEGSAAPASESISGYSYSLSETEKLAQQQNFKTTSQKKLYWIGLFCDIRKGLC